MISIGYRNKILKKKTISNSYKLARRYEIYLSNKVKLYVFN